MRFMMMMIPDVYRRPVSADFVPPADAMEKMGKFNEELRKAGVLLALDGLHPPEKAVRLTFPATGKPVVTDGPFAEAKEAVGGYWLLQVKSREEAIEWARRCPAEPGDVLEIRKIFEPEDFGPAVAQQERELMEKIGKTK
ncbi:MAG TPA: YciI family protein [Methylovirgula sp.]|nr:YciI family protein [Methylovirgula sp.]